MIDGLLIEVRADERSTAATAAAAVGATAVPVEDVTPFDDDGGQVDIAGIGYDYDGVDTSTVGPDGDGGALLLVTPLTVAVEEFDPISVLIGTDVAVDFYAVVDLGEDDEASHHIEVPLETREERLAWPVRVYDPPLPVGVADDLSRLVSAPGVVPQIDAGVVDPETVTPDVAAEWGVIVQDQLDAEAERIDGDIAAIQNLTIVDTPLNDAIDEAIAKANEAFNTSLGVQLAGANLVVDGSFETATWDNLNTRFVRDTAKKRSGTYSLRCDPATPAAAVTLALLPGEFPVQPGQTWRFRVYYQTASDYNGTSTNSKLRVFKNGNVGVGGVLFQAAQAAWTLAEYQVVVPSDGSIATLGASLVSDHTAGSIWFEDVEIVNITESQAALAAANGKNKVTHSTGLPGTTPNTAGDTWFQHKDSGLDQVIAQWRGAGGTSWTKVAFDPVVIPQIDIGSGTFGTLSGLRVNASEITVSQSQVTGLSTALTGARTGAVSDLKTLWGEPTDSTKINGGLIATNTILAQSLTLADFTDYVHDPSFDRSDSWSLGSGWSILTLQASAPNTRNKRSLGYVGTSASAYSQAAEVERVNVQPGDEFSLSLTCKRQTGGTGGNLSAYVFVYDSAGTYIGAIGGINLTGVAADGVWRDTYESSMTIPVNGATAVTVIRATAGTVGSWYFDEIHLRRKAEGSLIVDGAIVGRHFTGDTFTGVIMTAPLIQTHAAGGPDYNGVSYSTQTKRGIKIVASENGGYGSFIAYNSSGQATFTLNGQTGDVILAGSLTAGSTISGFNIVGSSLSTASSGARVTVENISGVGYVRFYGSGASPLGFIQVATSGVYPGGFIRLAGPGAATVDVSGTTVSFGGATNLDATGATFHANALFDDSLNTGSTTGASINGNGRVVRTGSSSRDFKQDVEPLSLETAQLALRLEAVTFQYRPEMEMGDRQWPGFIAEQAHEAGAGLWVAYTNDDEDTGKPIAFRYAELTAAHNVLIRDLYDRIAALERK